MAAPITAGQASTLSVVVPSPLRRALEDLAEREQRSLSGQIRVALTQHVRERETAGAA